MITLGDTDYATSPGGARARDGAPVVRRPGHARRLARRVDERGHGDVPPGRRGRPSAPARTSRTAGPSGPGGAAAAPESGPPADYDPATFGEGNIYYGPALMWHELRGGSASGSSGRGSGPGRSAHENGNASYEDIAAWWSTAPAGTSPPSSTPGCSAGRPRPAPTDPSLVHASARRPVACSRVSAPTRRLCARERTRVAARPDRRFGVRMRLLVLGGTVFLSRAVAEEVVRRGHEVTCACRGASGSCRGRRGTSPGTAPEAAPARLPRRPAYDAVVDVARHPSWVRTAVAALPDAHWVFVSTINVYADDSTPRRASRDDPPLREPITDDVDLGEDPEAYGAMKVACEQAGHRRRGLRDGGPARADRRPRRPDRPVHLLAGAAGRRAGPRGAGPRRARRLGPGDRRARPRGLDRRQRRAAPDRRLRRHRAGALPSATCSPRWPPGCRRRRPTLTWVAQDFLAEHEVEPWAGPRSVPLWLPRPEYAG